MRTVKLANDGYALPLRIEHLMTMNDLVSALCCSAKDCAEDELPNLSNREVVDRVREVVRANGEDLYFWADGEDSRWASAVEAWARPLVERAFGKAFAR